MAPQLRALVLEKELNLVPSIHTRQLITGNSISCVLMRKTDIQRVTSIRQKDVYYLNLNST